MDKLDDPVYQTRYNKRIDKILGVVVPALSILMIATVIWRLTR
jgi:hypothetical protein